MVGRRAACAFHRERRAATRQWRRRCREMYRSVGVNLALDDRTEKRGRRRERGGHRRTEAHREAADERTGLAWPATGGIRRPASKQRPHWSAAPSPNSTRWATSHPPAPWVVQRCRFLPFLHRTAPTFCNYFAPLNFLLD